MALKNIQQEIQMLKQQYHFGYKESHNAGGIVTTCPDQEKAKNILPQPVMFGQ